MVSTIGIISLSSGYREDFVKHEVNLGSNDSKTWDSILSFYLIH